MVQKSIAVNVFKQALYGDAFLKNFLSYKKLNAFVKMKKAEK